MAAKTSNSSGSSAKPKSKTPRHVRKAKPKKGAPKAGARAGRAKSGRAVPAEPVHFVSVRLQKLLAAAGFGSRRACEELIRQGRVTVNSTVAKVGDSATPGRDKILLDGERIVGDKPVYWMVNKPEGVITSARDPEGRTTVLSLLPPKGPRMFPVGRLDLGTSGLVLLTNDGDMTQKLLHPSLGNEREYRVTVKGCVPDKAFVRLRAGIRLDDGMTGKTEVSNIRVDPKGDITTFSLTLTEGRKRQIRRSMQVLKHPVKRLVRVRMGPLRLGRLARGQSRALRADEIRALRQHVSELRPKPKPRSRRKSYPKPRGRNA